MSSKQDEQAIRTSLQASLDQAEWSWLKKHSERDALIIVTLDIALVDAGVRIALDDAATVQAWIQTGKISKPRREQLDAWDSAPATKFMSLVVQPYVLIQEILH